MVCSKKLVKIKKKKSALWILLSMFLSGAGIFAAQEPLSMMPVDQATLMLSSVFGLDQGHMRLLKRCLEGVAQADAGMIRPKVARKIDLAIRDIPILQVNQADLDRWQAVELMPMFLYVGEFSSDFNAEQFLEFVARLRAVSSGGLVKSNIAESIRDDILYGGSPGIPELGEGDGFVGDWREPVFDEDAPLDSVSVRRDEEKGD